MKSIKQLTIENFGPYRSAQFDFGKGLNLIRGPNRSGKTWLLRAIAAVLYNWGAFNNDDSLDELRHEDESGKKAPSFTIRLDFSDGSWVQRHRGKTENSYILCPVDGHPEKHSAIGRSFYEPIGQLTGIFPVKLDGREDYPVNMRLLEDPRFFIIGDSPQRQDAILTRLVGINILEQAADEATSERRELIRRTSQIEEELGVVNNEVRKYEPLPQLIKDLQVAAEGLSQWKRLSQTADRATTLLERQTSLVLEKIRLCASTEVISSIVSDVRMICSEASRIAAITNQATQLISKRNQLAEEHRLNALLLERYKQLPQIVFILEEAEELAQSATNSAKGWQQRTTLITQQRDLKSSVDELGRVINTLIQQRKNSLLETGVCPLCGQIIKED